LWAFRLSSDPFEAGDAVHTKDSLAKPALVVSLPFVLRRTEAAKALGPERKESTEIRQGSCRHILHFLYRIQERADTPHLLHGAEHGIGSLAGDRGRVHTRHILRDARVRVDTEHLVDELVLAEINVRDGDRQQKRLENASGRGMIAGEERFAAQAQVLGDVGRVGVSHDSRRFSERLRVIDDSLSGTAGLPTGAALHRTGDERIANRRSRVGAEFIQHAAHERA